MKRSYERMLKEHFENDTQMAFVAGPRQVGKTTSCTSFASKHISTGIIEKKYSPRIVALMDKEIDIVINK